MTISGRQYRELQERMISTMPTRSKMPSLLEYFADLPEPRIDRCKKHALIDIIAIAILASICGAEHFTEMEESARCI
jgi:hypothetical protein